MAGDYEVIDFGDIPERRSSDESEDGDDDEKGPDDGSDSDDALADSEDAIQDNEDEADDDDNATSNYNDAAPRVPSEAPSKPFKKPSKGASKGATKAHYYGQDFSFAAMLKKQSESDDAPQKITFGAVLKEKQSEWDYGSWSEEPSEVSYICGTNWDRDTAADYVAFPMGTCGDVKVKRGEPIRCKNCGGRILFKKRTNRMVQFEAR